jgi:hypothetical protein
MRKSIFILGCVLSIQSCNQTSTVKNNPGEESRAIDILNEEPNVAVMRAKYIAGYATEHKTDTIITTGGQNFRVISRHYCLFDSALYIPEKYNWEDSTRDFISHNYVQDLRIFSGNDTTISTIIRKEAFNRILYPELKSAGTILSAELAGYNPDTDEFEFVYNIGIPMTDVGMRASLYVDKTGKTRISD